MQHSGSMNWMIRGLMICGLAGLMLAGYAWTRLGAASPEAFHGTAYPDSPPAPDFALIDHRGESVTLSDFEGGAVLVFFGFTRCPDICPLTLTRLARVVRERGYSPEQIRVLLVSVDPTYDSPERLAEYLAPHGPAFAGLTGSVDTIQEVLTAYGAYAERRRSDEGVETIAHTGLVFAIDAAGRLRALLHPEESVESLGEDVETLVALSS